MKILKKYRIEDFATSNISLYLLNNFSILKHYQIVNLNGLLFLSKTNVQYGYLRRSLRGIITDIKTGSVSKVILLFINTRRIILKYREDNIKKHKHNYIDLSSSDQSSAHSVPFRQT